METLGWFTYLGDRVSAGVECEAAVTVSTRCGWAKFRGCGNLLHGRRICLQMKRAVYRSCVLLAMLYGSEAWCLKKSEISNVIRTDRSKVRAVCGVQLIGR